MKISPNNFTKCHLKYNIYRDNQFQLKVTQKLT